MLWLMSIEAAYPASVATAARAVGALVPAASPPMGAIAVQVDGETVTLPVRIYAAEVASATVAALSPDERLVLHCLYTRHHDGFVRARHLDPVLAADAAWAVPFVVHLIGEYVLEIVQTIAGRLDLGPASADRTRYGEFVRGNRRYVQTVASRVVSYWNCYHRARCPQLAAYPGAVLMGRLRAAAG
jgi:hypothetical protein